jgi:hypothetical protein
MSFHKKFACQDYYHLKVAPSKWMRSGAHGSTHDSSARGPGFDPSPKPRKAFLEALISLLSENRLKNNCNILVKLK